MNTTPKNNTGQAKNRTTPSNIQGPITGRVLLTCLGDKDYFRPVSGSVFDDKFFEMKFETIRLQKTYAKSVFVYSGCTQNAHFQTPKKGRVLGTGARFGYNIGMAKRGRVLGTGARFEYRGRIDKSDKYGYKSLFWCVIFVKIRTTS